jgi:hypothetical protein
MAPLDYPVFVWYASFIALAVFNLLLVGISWWSFGVLGPRTEFRRRQLQYSFVYALVCISRTLIPRADVQRFTIFDHWIASVAVGRSLATAGELCFVAQWALLLYEYSRAAEYRFGEKISKLLVPMIAVAECCSWYSVITTSYRGNAIEESLWGLAAALLTVAVVGLLVRAPLRLRGFLALVTLFSVCDVIYMVCYDVPMYLSRLRADMIAGKPIFGFLDGLYDVSHRWVVTGSWANWGPEVAWMSFYFSLAVWASLAVPYAPVYETGKK